MKRKFMLVWTYSDLLMKPTYAFLKKERANILRLNVRTLLMEVAPGSQQKSVYDGATRNLQVSF